MSIHARLYEAGLGRLPRPVWLEVDVDALRNNVSVVREMVGPRAEIYAVVKADAYGHGLKAVGRIFESAGVDRLSVASLDEAFALRDAGVTLPIIVLFPAPLGSLNYPAAAGIEITLSDPTAARRLQRFLGPAPELLGVHVEVETGLTRGGLKPEAVPAAIASLEANPYVRVAGMWTHLATPEDEATTSGQIAEFELATSLVRAAGLTVPPRHVAATGGLLTGRAPTYEGVRIGLGLYGLLPLDLPIPEELGGFADRLRPAMQLKCQALRVERFPAGVGVSYGGRWRTERESVIATLPVGYADAIPRPAPWGEVLVKGRRMPLVGNVAMDAVMADVTDIADSLGPEDEFVLLGPQGGDEIAAQELSRVRNTIPWEVVTGMSYRIPRVYHAASVLVGIRTLNSETHVSSSRLTNEGVHGVINQP